LLLRWWSFLSLLISLSFGPGLVGFNLRSGAPFSVGYPIISIVHCASHHKQALRHSSFERFVDGFPLQRHRDGIGLICAGIVKFSVDHDSHRDEVRFAVGSELNQSERSRSFAGVSALGDLGEGE
jgi:hypothetical protein